jgi:dGTPase
MIGFSTAIAAEQAELKQFLRHALYRHYRVVRMSAKSQRILSELFSAFMRDRRLLPPQDQARAAADAPRAIADYIAGMTDRYAIREHRRLFSVDEH